MKLNKKQKQFLLEKDYVNAYVLDADMEEGWQDFYIKHYNWVMDIKYAHSGSLVRLELQEKDSNYIAMDLGVIFHGNDLEEFKSLA